MTLNAWVYESSLGDLVLFSNGETISEVQFASQLKLPSTLTATSRKQRRVRKQFDGLKELRNLLKDIGYRVKKEPFDTAVDELDQYFQGELDHFTCAFNFNDWGTPFQREVWQSLCDIPYGSTMTYSDIARKIGNPKAQRAVGLANNRNPLPIFVPCHRVIGSNGSLVGYAGGLPFKRALLELESGDIQLSSQLETTQDSILQVAIEEFARYGFNGARIDRIAKDTGINKRMIYVHFGSKDGLSHYIYDNLDTLPMSEKQRAQLYLWRLVSELATSKSSQEDFLKLVQQVSNAQRQGYIVDSVDATDLAKISYLIEQFSGAIPTLKEEEAPITSGEPLMKLLRSLVSKSQPIKPVVKRIVE